MYCNVSGLFCTVGFNIISNGLIRTLYVIVFAYLFCPGESIEIWQINQASHQPRSYNNTELDSLCRLGDTKRINNHLDNILVARPVESANHRRVGLYIKNVLETAGYYVEYDHFHQETVVGNVEFRNIIATFDPNAPRRLVLACHYDSKDFRPGFEFLGATDSALPCTLMLDVAQSLKDLMSKRQSSDLTLQLIFFDGEEAFRQWTPSDSLYGSKHLAKKWEQTPYPPDNIFGTTELNRIDVLLLLDLLGAREPRIQNYALFNNRKAYTLLAESELQLSYVPGCLRTIPTIFRNSDIYASTEDDHLPFLQRSKEKMRDVRIVHLIPIPFPQEWHSAKDNRDALDPSTVENLSSILRIFTARYLTLNL